MAQGKFVVLGVTGSIAAYKAPEILRGLRKRGTEVAVVVTGNALRFVGAATFEALSGRPVSTDLFSPLTDASMEHLALARRADLVLVAPATANTIARLAAGLADDLLTTLCLAAEAPLLLAPAMNTRMIRHPATEANIALLARRGAAFVEPEEGPLAEGEEGYGRLADVATIVERAERLLQPLRDLEGRRIVVTAGPTREAIDPVRFLSNRSSGKMGYALAAEAIARGAEVTLVSGPVSLEPPRGARLVGVESAEEMRAAVGEALPECDVLVMAAAVSDFRPGAPREGKIKKGRSEGLTLELERTPDILGGAGGGERRPLLVGFAAETERLAEGALKKLKEKRLDLVVANDVTVAGAGFDGDTNVVEIFEASGESQALPLLPKREVAARILDRVAALLAGAKR